MASFFTVFGPGLFCGIKRSRLIHSKQKPEIFWDFLGKREGSRDPEGKAAEGLRVNIPLLEETLVLGGLPV